MKIVVLMDSFKGSLTSVEAFLSADKDSRKIKVNVSGPRGRMTGAYYGVLRDNGHKARRGACNNKYEGATVGYRAYAGS